MLYAKPTPAGMAEAEETQGTDTPDNTLVQLVRWVEEAEDVGREAREKSERDRDYYDGRQLTHQEAAELRRRNQPVIAFNLIQGKVDYLLGLEKAQRSDPKAFPRNPDDEQAATAATDAIRYVCDNADFQMVASDVWEHMIVEGAGGCDVCVEPEPNGDVAIRIHPVPWDRMIYDPHSRRKDFADAKYLGVIIWMDEADLLASYPDAKDILDLAYEASRAKSETWDDRPRHNVWADERRKRVRVVQLYWQTGGQWQTGTFMRGGFLTGPEPSPYVDEHGQPTCPLVFGSAYVNRENERYGAVRNLIDPQDEINLRHRKAIHLLSVRQVVAEEGAVRDVDKARQELAKPDGFIEVAPGMRFEMQSTADLSTGQAQLLQEAKSVFQTMGPNAALLGKQGSQASGRAIALSQQGGAMEIGALLDEHRHWRRRVYRAIWERVRQFWTAEKWVRVTDDERNVRFVPLNQPMLDEMGNVIVHNDVSRMMVDIVVEEGPDVATLRIEQFQALADLARAGVPIPPIALIKASSLPNKESILEEMERAQGGPPPPDPRLLEVERKAARDMADVDLGNRRLALDEAKAGLEADKAVTDAAIQVGGLLQQRRAFDADALAQVAGQGMGG